MMESVGNLHIVLFIGVLCVVQTMDMICPYTDPACTHCTEDYVLCEDLEEIPTLNTGPNVYPLKLVFFKFGNITDISSTSLPPNITSIFLEGHPLTNISDDAFDTSAATLETLQIQRATFTTLPEAITKLTKLNLLSIESTWIEEWDTEILKHIAATLKMLDLRNVGLTAWPAWISDFALLEQISLSGNSLKSIPDDAFNSVKDSLLKLSLAGTDLTHIPQALSVLKVLWRLDLSNNTFTDLSEIRKITESSFAPKLNELLLGSTGMTEVANFSNLPSLRYISLPNNGISDLPSGSLPTTLTTLVLSDNRLTAVPSAVGSMSKLYFLNLERNLITSIEPNSFPSSLRTLDISANRITVINNVTFSNLKKMHTLKLAHNPITEISSAAFSDLPLQIFDITDTELTEIPMALTLLRTGVHMSWSTKQPLSCPCPVSSQLVQWNKELEFHGTINVTCSNGQSIGSYLKGECRQNETST